MCYLMMEKSIEGFMTGWTSEKYFSILNNPNQTTNNKYYITLDTSKKYKFKASSDQQLLLNASSYGYTSLNNTGNYQFTGLSKDSSYNLFYYTSGGGDNSYNLYEITTNTTSPINYDLSSVSLSEDNSGTLNLLLLADLSGNIYDLSNNLMRRLFMHIDNIPIIQLGVIDGSPIPIDIGPLSSTGSTTTTTGWSGDINFKDMFKGFNNGQFPSNMTPEMYAYMLQGSMGLGNQGYTMPFYNSFESAMNNPSNPLVNPTNAMNPLQYNQSLFGPNVSPMMAQNMCKNSSADKSEKVREDDKSKDSTINSSLGSNNVLNSTFDKLNSSANTMLAQNTGDEGKGGTSGTSGNNSQNSSINPPPCPPCARCPESNYECKKVPAYEQGYENTALPRPVLTDFSTFGM